MHIPHTVRPALRSGSISSVHMLQNAGQALHIRSSGSCPCCSGHRPCKPALRPLICQAARGSSACLQASGSDDTHWSGHSIPELLHISQAPPRFPVQNHGTQYHRRYVQEHVQYLQCFPFYRSGSLTDQGRWCPFPCHALQPRRNIWFWCWSFQRSVPHSFLCNYLPEFLLFSYALPLLQDQADTKSPPGCNSLMLRNVFPLSS